MSFADRADAFFNPGSDWGIQILVAIGGFVGIIIFVALMSKVNEDQLTDGWIKSELGHREGIQEGQLVSLVREAKIYLQPNESKVIAIAAVGELFAVKGVAKNSFGNWYLIRFPKRLLIK